MTKKRILIVDDSELVLEMAKDALEVAGYHVATATTGIEANRHIFSTKKPDLIILDVLMPMMNGDRKAKLLAEREHSKDIPILLISSKSEDELLRLASESGAKGYIRKPFTTTSIVNSVKIHIGEC